MTKELPRALDRIAKTGMVIAIAIAVIVCYPSRPLQRWVFGEAFDDAEEGSLRSLR